MQVWSAVKSGRVLLRLPYGEFHKEDFPKRTRSFDFEKKLWVVDLALEGKLPVERAKIYEAAEVLLRRYGKYLSPEAKQLAQEVLQQKNRDPLWEVSLSGGVVFISAVPGTKVWQLAQRFLPRDGTVFQAPISGVNFKVFIEQVPQWMREKILEALREQGRAGRHDGLLLSQLKRNYPFLFDFQLKGVAFLLERRRSVLADFMGMGKTLQGAAAGLFMRAKGEAKRLLVVCPATLKDQWRAHLLSDDFFHLAPHEVVLIGGRPAKRKNLWEQALRAKAVIVNYELVRKDTEEFKRAARGTFLVLDEASFVKNHKGKTYKAIKKAMPLVSGASALTATPIENGPEEFFAILRLLGLSTETTTWKEFYEKYTIRKTLEIRTKQGRKIPLKIVVGYKNLDKFRREVAPHVLRRTPQDVNLSLPKVRQKTFVLPLDGPQAEAVRVITEGIARTYEQELQRYGERKAEANVLARISLVRGAEASPFVLKDSKSQLGKAAWEAASRMIREDYLSPKEAELYRVLLQVNVPTVVFTQFEREARRLREILKGKLSSTPIYLVSGGVRGKEKLDRLKSFKLEKGRAVLVTTDTIAYGWNLTNAAVVVNFDLLWNPQKMEQRLRRAVRLDSVARSVLVVNLVADGLEKTVAEILNYKINIFEAVLGKQAGKARSGITALRRTVKYYILSKARR